MKALIISDNHGDTYHMEEILSIYEKEIDLWIHCGDSEFTEENPLWQNYHTVKGNMDNTNAFPESTVVKYYDNSFLVAHGHLHNVKSSFSSLKKEAEKEGVQVVFYGHTHIPRVDKEDNIYFINPGSISQPRGPIHKGTYAILELEDNSGIVRYYDEEYNPVPQLNEKIEL